MACAASLLVSCCARLATHEASPFSNEPSEPAMQQRRKLNDESDKPVTNAKNHIKSQPPDALQTLQFRRGMHAFAVI